jgi:hypothetical protein
MAPESTPTSFYLWPWAASLPEGRRRHELALGPVAVRATVDVRDLVVAAGHPQAAASQPLVDEPGRLAGEVQAVDHPGARPVRHRRLQRGQVHPDRADHPRLRMQVIHAEVWRSECHRTSSDSRTPVLQDGSFSQVREDPPQRHSCKGHTRHQKLSPNISDRTQFNL